MVIIWQIITKKDIDLCLDYVNSKYPEIAQYINQTNNQEYGYLRNMFIAKKGHF